MSSPLRSSDQSRSSPRSSPSRLHVNGIRRERVNGYHKPRKESIDDSPSRQLIEEFSRVRLAQDKQWNKALDEAEAEQQLKHRDALDRAHAEHEAIRQAAERARIRVELEIVRERRRREEEEKRAVDKAKRELAEQEAEDARRQLAEAKKKEDAEREKAAAEREKEEVERRTIAHRQHEESERIKRKAAHDQQETDCKAREAAVERERQQQQVQKPQVLSQQPNGLSAQPRPPDAAASHQQPAKPATTSQPTPSASPPNPLTSSHELRDTVHRQYLDLHKRLKVFRKSYLKECEAKGAKQQVGDWRREINVKVGQLNKVDKAANKATMATIQHILDQAAQIPEPSVDISQYIIDQYGNVPKSGTATQGSATLLYLLNMLAKKLVAQFKHECAVDTPSADPLGVLATIMFARPNYRFNNQSLIDVLWAKYHRECPALFGITAKESSKSGRVRLGWRPRGVPTETAEDIKALAPSDFPSDQEWYTSQTGLGAGFAAITLRDFSRSPNPNPAPNTMWWEALARIVNLPADLAQPTHYVLVKCLLEDHVDRIQKIFGQAGVAAIRKAVMEFPKVGPAKQPSVVAVESMRITLRQKYGLAL